MLERHGPKTVVTRGAVASLLLLCVCSCSSGAASTSDGPDAANDVAESMGCKDPQVSPGELLEIQLEHDGLLREYWLYVGRGADSAARKPLVLNFHGLTSDPERQRSMSGMWSAADERGAVVATPRGISKSFNGGSCCGQFVSPANDADDLGFSRAIVTDVRQQVCVDDRRVYSTGMSNGGYMTEYNGCKSADVFAAIAPVSALGLPQPSCEPSRPMPLIAFNGTADSLVSYEDTRESVDAWVARNGCSDEPRRERYGESHCDTWSDCRDGVEVVSCTVSGMDHCWPGSIDSLRSLCESTKVADIDATKMMWDFFERFKLPR